MKKIFILFVTAAFLAACNAGSKQANTSEKQEVAESTGENFSVDSSSVVGWVATHKGGADPHTGIIKVNQGSIAVDNGEVSGGSFTFDVANIQDLDITDAEKKAQLEGHLKSADFFDVEKYPTASFEITGIQPFDSTIVKSDLAGATHTVSGNLTFKDSTLNIQFPAKIAVAEDAATINAKFAIDRTAWGLNYKGPNNPQDWLISKEVELSIELVVKK